MTETEMGKIISFLEGALMDISNETTRRTEVDFGDYTVKAYAMGKNIRIDIIPQKGQDNG